MRFVILGNPDNRRVHFFQEALARRSQAPADVVSWSDGLQEDVLATRLDRDTLLRIDSPEGEERAFRAFLVRGAACIPRSSTPFAAAIDATTAQQHTYDGSGLRLARQRHLGFESTLEDVAQALHTSGARCTHPPHDIAEMSDKSRCYERLAQHNLPLPARLDVNTTKALLDELQDTPTKAAFVKLWHGSSAAGIGALRHTSAGLELLTSMKMTTQGPFSSLRLRQYTHREDICEILDWLYAQGAHTECWLPKLTIDEREFDLRVVVIAQHACHVVARISRHESPMTNLHFGNERGTPEAVRQHIGQTRWDEAMQLCERAARCFPESLCIGFDLMFDHEANPFLIEANAFGDLLPGILWQGHNTYEAQVDAALQQHQERA